MADGIASSRHHHVERASVTTTAGKRAETANRIVASTEI
jgi:hypothetical protein